MRVVISECIIQAYKGQHENACGVYVCKYNNPRFDLDESLTLNDI